MRYTLSINAVRCQEWGLNLAQGALMDLINQSNSWAQEEFVDGKVYYWVSRNKVIDEIPVAYSKPDTVYRSLKVLADKDLISHIKKGKKDLVRMTEKGKTWNVKGTIQGDAKLGNKSELAENSEINPSKLGNKSEKQPKNTDLNPTDKNTNYKSISNKNTKSAPKEKPVAKQFVKPTLEQVRDYFIERDHQDAVKESEKWIDYYTANGWKVGKNSMKDWKAAIRNWMRNYKPQQNNFQGNNNANAQSANSQHQPKQSQADIYAAKLAEQRRQRDQSANTAATECDRANVYDMEAPI